jgi:imipenem/basic amino acid-specific outer membrane pore
MKLVKMSLAAAMLMGASAFAIDNVKVSGDAKLFYSTNDAMNPSYEKIDSASLFDKTSSAGQAALGLGVTADLMDGVSAGTHMTALSTLGLYNNLVANVWEGGVEDEYWFDEAWIAATMGKTTFKVGRMALDTPLVFSETWSIAQNTFEAGVLVNQDLPDTTLVAAYVGQTSGSMLAQKSGYAGVTADFVGGSANTNFSSFWNGAYAFGLVNNSFKPLTVQAWYFDAQQAVQAYWVQADLNMEGIVAGAQYTGITYTKGGIVNTGTSDIDSNAFAVKLGYEADAFSVSGAYSQTDKDAGAGFNLDGYGQSKLYTEAWWNYGYITQADTSAFNITATATVADFGLSAFYTASTNDTTDVDMNELTLEVDKSFGALDTSLVYINTDADDQNDGSASNTLQVYLTLNF